MSDYTRQNDFSVKDGLPSGSSQKIIRGTDVDAEFDALVSAVASKLDDIAAATTGNVPLIGSSGTTLTDSGRDLYGFFPLTDVRSYGAKGDGTTDDTDGINAAITAATPATSETDWATSGGSTVYLPPGIFPISDEVYVPGFVNLVGSGRGLTVFKLTAAGARIRFGSWSDSFGTAQRGGTSGHFTIDGNDTATNGLIVGFVVQRQFVDIMVKDAAGEGVLIEAAQNCNFYGLFSEHNGADAGGTGSNLKIDYGAGNNRFYGVEINRPGKYNVEFVQTGVSPAGAFSVPTGNTFYGGIIERWEDADGTGVVESLGAIYHGAGRYNRFNDCDISLTSLASALPMVIIRKDGAGASALLFFNNCAFLGTAAHSTVFDADGAVTLFLTGRNFFENHNQLFLMGDDSRAYVDNLYQSTVATYFAAQAGATVTEIVAVNNPQYVPTQWTKNTGTVAFQSFVTGDTVPRLQLDTAGPLEWGPGNAALDVNLYRGAANRLQTDDQFRAPSLLLAEQGAAPDAVANMAVIYAIDNGAGKTQLMVRFGTGAAQQISIEP